MASETLTAAEALEEVLDRVFHEPSGWRYRLERIDSVLHWPDSVCLNRKEGLTVAHLRRWSAPLLREDRPESVSQEELVRCPVVAMEALMPWERMEALVLMEKKFCLDCGEDGPHIDCPCTRDD